MVFDDACLLWQNDCGETGACLYYDNEAIGLNVFLLVVCFKVFSLILIVMAWLLYKPPKKETDDVPGKVFQNNTDSKTDQMKENLSNYGVNGHVTKYGNKNGIKDNREREKLEGLNNVVYVSNNGGVGLCYNGAKLEHGTDVITKL